MKSNMADELDRVDHLPKLEDLCVKFIRANVNCWKPEDFLGIPRHLLFPLLEKLHPLEIEKLEVSGVFQTMGIDTDPLWRDIYTARWPRKSKWPEVYFKTKRIRREQEQWRVYYLQRQLQEALNSSGAAKSSTFSAGSESLQNIVSVCGRYAAYLRLYNPACICLAENWDIVLQLAEYVEFIEVFLLRDNGVDSLCHLLQAFASKRLKSIGFCFCKVNNVDMWSEIIGSLSQVSHQKGCSITGREKNVIEVPTGDNDKSHINQMCSTASNGTPNVPSGESMNENDSCISRQNILHEDDLDIYEFADGSDNHFSLSRTDEKSTEVCSTKCKSDGCLHQAVSSEISAGISSDLYDEVFSSSEAPKELCDINQEPQQTGSTLEKCQIIPESVKMKSQLNRLSNLGCSLIHFELVAFWLHQDLLELFVHSLKSWLNLESLTLEDNGLGLLHPSSSLKLMDTLFFLCSQGQLQKLKITNNLVTDDVAKFLIEKLVGSFCDKCNQNSKSLRKLKFSSSQVSEAFSAYLGKAIRDVCFCKSRNHSYSAEMLDPVSISGSSTSKSKTPDGVDLTQADCNKDLTQADFVVQQTCSCCVGFPVLCNNDCLERRKAKHTKAASGHKNMCYDSTQTTNNPESHGTCCEEMPAVDSSQDLSHRPLSFTACDATVFGIKELRVTCLIWDRGASLIADGLQRNSSLHSLSLVKCNISTSGLADIFQALTGNRCLKHLSVKGNSYDLGNNDSLAEMLASNNALTDLDLSSCKLGGHVTELGTAIIHALCINSTLTSLKLEKNRLGDAHITALSQVFSHPSQVSRIVKLDLSNNPISLECLSDLASSLQCIRPRKLDELKLTGNILGSKQHQVMSSLRSVVRSVIAEHLDKATLFADFISQM